MSEHQAEQVTAPPDIKALPCPFCGTPPYVAMKGHAVIACIGEDCFGPRTTADYLVDAMKQWNARVPAVTTEGKPVAWGRVIDGKAVTVSLARTGANDEPLYAVPPSSKPAGREHLTVETMEADFDEWRKTLTVVDRPSNFEIYSQGYVGGWNAKEASGDARVEECADIALAIDSGRGNEKEIAKAIRALSTGAKP